MKRRVRRDLEYRNREGAWVPALAGDVIDPPADEEDRLEALGLLGEWIEDPSPTAGAVGGEGVPGPPGPEGPPGPAGPPGPPGVDGAPGAKGDRGDVGPPGPKGDRGDTGTPGVAGDVGPKGDKGDTGAPGTDGLPGPKGDTGAPGTPGTPGAQGGQGPKGDKGDPGTAGAPGGQGIQGVPGTPGAPGADGRTIWPVAGAPAAALGAAGDFAIDSAAGALYGPRGASSWPAGKSLVGPQGGQGIQGTPGIQGIPGVQGPPGPGLVTKTARQAADSPANTAVARANTDLVFDFEAGSVYVIDVYALITSAATTTGLALALDTTVAVTAQGITFEHQLATAGTLTGGDAIADDTPRGISSGVPTANALVPVLAKGLLVAGGTAGTCRLRFASEVAGSGVVFKAGSVLVAQRVA